MNAINVRSEIGPLKKVLLHRPGNELLNLTPDTLTRLLFDDIPFLPDAQKEHDEFANILKTNGVEVVYLEDLMAEVLEINGNIEDKFLKQFILEAGIKTPKYKNLVFEYLKSFVNKKELVLKTMEGIKLFEINRAKREVEKSLVDLVSEESDFLADPMPNLYFTRDPFASIGNGISLNKMYSVTRNRETIYAEYIFNYHPEYKDTLKYYDRYNNYHIEVCDCGVTGTLKKPHVIRAIDVVNQKAPCLECGYIVDCRNDTGMLLGTNIKYSINGSLVLSNGIIILVDEDINDYFLGCLIFYKSNELPNYK